VPDSGMKKYSDVVKIKSKQDLVRPDFHSKLVSKSLKVNNEINKSEEVIIYLEDSTSSMKKHLGFSISKGVQKSLINVDNPVYYYRLCPDYPFKLLKSKEDKSKLYSSEQDYFIFNIDYTYIINFIESQYSNSTIIISTDGDDIDKMDFETTNKYNVVTGVQSRNLKSLCNRTNGKYLII